MTYLTTRYCPKCGKSIGMTVIEYLCRDCDEKLCIDCGDRHPDVGNRCVSCHVRYVHQTIQDAHEKAKDSKIRFKAGMKGD